jgi:hypothetical protein
MKITGHGRHPPWPEAPYGVKCPDGTPKRENLRPAPSESPSPTRRSARFDSSHRAQYVAECGADRHPCGQRCADSRSRGSFRSVYAAGWMSGRR